VLSFISHNGSCDSKGLNWGYHYLRKEPVLYIQAPSIFHATGRWWPCHHEVEGSNHCTHSVQEGDICAVTAVNIQCLTHTTEACFELC
jgi:hypothetical protein